MNLDKLRVFYHAALAKSFSNCGLTISPSAVSRHVSDLEYSMKVKLFFRNPRGIILTSEGEELYHTCTKIFQELEMVREQFSSDNSKIEGVLRINMPGGWVSSILLHRVKEYLGQYPEVRLAIYNYDRMTDFSRNEADISITTVEPDDPELHYAYITTFNLALYATKEYLEEYGTPEKLSDLDNHRLIALTDGKGVLTDLDWHLKADCSKGQARSAYLMVNNLFDACGLGYGIATLAKENPHLNERNLVHVLPEIKGPQMDIYCVYPARFNKSRRVMSFVEFLREAAQKEFAPKA